MAFCLAWLGLALAEVCQYDFSYQSRRICDYFERVPLKVLTSNGSALRSLEERIYEEAEDNEMDLWIKVTVHF